MTDKTRIGNLALQLLREPPTLTNIELDTGNAGLQLRACYDEMLDEVLGAHPWDFAKDLQALTAESPPPAFGFAFRYRIPKGDPYWIRPHMLDDKRYPPEAQWQEVAGFIHTDEPGPLYVIGIKRVTDPALFSSYFVNTLAHRLAIQVGPALGVPDTRLDVVEKAFDKLLMNARSVDGQTGQPGPPEEGEFLSARRSG